MHSNFSVTCPHCNKLNDFTGGNWHDELIDVSEDHLIPCIYCNNDMLIRVDGIFTLSVVEDEDY